MLRGTLAEVAMIGQAPGEALAHHRRFPVAQAGQDRLLPYHPPNPKPAKTGFSPWDASSFI